MDKTEKRNRIEDITSKQLVLNVYISQGIFICLAFGIAFLFHVPFPWSFDDSISEIQWISAIGTGLLLPFLSVQLDKRLPDRYVDDGGINDKIFGSLSYLHIFFLTGIIAFAEEWLFRGVIQSLVGLVATSVIFSILHVRYIRKPVLFGIVTGLSFWLGFLYEWTDTIWVPFIAHFLIDFISGCWIRTQNKKTMLTVNGE
jgi:membrane protease YdiL (CAAX protease family)